jgi:tRNA (guanine9-N1)-methyltransferase
MAQIEENPSKRRKLDSSKDQEDLINEAFRPIPDDKGTSLSEEQQEPESEANDLSKLDVFEPKKEDPPLSKSQLKKRRRQEQWEAAKDLRKDKRRDKRHEKQARKAQEKAEFQEKVAKGEIAAPKISPEEPKSKVHRPVQVPVTLVLDCDFDELMTEKELISLGAQLTRCYSDNRHSKHRAHIVITSWKGALRTRFETVLTNHHKSWKGVRFMEKDFVGAGEDMDAVMRSQNGGLLAGAFAPREEGARPNANGGGHPMENGVETFPVEDGLRPSGGEPTLEHSVEVDLVSKVPKGEQPVPEESKDGPAAEQLPSASEPKDSIPTLPTLNSTSAPPGSAGEAQAEESTTTTATEPSIVYLTSDSPNTLDKLSPYTSYIIGGIVDKNRHKGLCYKRACERGIPTAKLPIGEYMTMQSRSVLATNHVVEIMLKWLDTADWGEAFLSVIPKRKEAKLRVQKEFGEESEDGEGDRGDEGSEQKLDVEDDGGIELSS